MEEMIILGSAILVLAIVLAIRGVNIKIIVEHEKYENNVEYLREMFEKANDANNKDEIPTDYQPDFKEVLEAIDNIYDKELDYGNEPRE